MLNFNYYFEILNALCELSAQTLDAVLSPDITALGVVLIEDPVVMTREVYAFFTEGTMDFLGNTIENCLLFIDLVLAISGSA